MGHVPQFGALINDTFPVFFSSRAFKTWEITFEWIVYFNSLELGFCANLYWSLGNKERFYFNCQQNTLG